MRAARLSPPNAEMLVDVKDGTIDAKMRHGREMFCYLVQLVLPRRQYKTVNAHKRYDADSFCALWGEYTSLGDGIAYADTYPTRSVSKGIGYVRCLRQTEKLASF